MRSIDTESGELEGGRGRQQHSAKAHRVPELPKAKHTQNRLSLLNPSLCPCAASGESPCPRTPGCLDLTIVNTAESLHTGQGVL